MSSDEESGAGLDGLASTAGSLASGSGLGELAASDASNDLDGPVPLVILFRRILYTERFLDRLTVKFMHACICPPNDIVMLFSKSSEQDACRLGCRSWFGVCCLLQSTVLGSMLHIRCLLELSRCRI